MSGGFTKLFNSILDSSVWGLSKDAKILWITIICKQDRDHYVEAPVPGIARAAGLSIEETEKALLELMAPDPYSGNPAHEGRRLIRDQRGLFVVSGKKYRDLLNKEAVRASKSRSAAKRRAREKELEYPRNGKPLPGEVAYCEEQLRIARAEEG